MYECAKVVDSGAGVLFLVKNYTGDVLSFEAAAEMLHEEGIQVQNILIDDDVAVKDSLYTAGRRGVGTTVIMEKLVGAAAEEGRDLDALADLARRINQNGRSMGMAFTSCTVPSAGKPTFTLGENEMELGVGIHGEPGQRRVEIASADDITELLANEILDDPAYTRTVREWDHDAVDWVEHELTDPPFAAGDQFIALVNSMGGTPVGELYTVYAKLQELIKARDMSIARSLIGAYVTSLEMQGCSITLVKGGRGDARAVGRAGRDAGVAVGTLKLRRKHPQMRPDRRSNRVFARAAFKNPRTKKVQQFAICAKLKSLDASFFVEPFASEDAHSAGRFSHQP